MLLSAASRSLLVSVSLLLSLDHVQGQDVGSNPATPSTQTSVRARGPLPPGCEVEELVATLEAFLSAFNRGSADELVRAFPSEIAYPYTNKRGFQWYSVTDENGHFVAYDPGELPAYFAARHEHHEQLTLLDVEFRQSWHPGVDMVFRLRREADDVSRQRMNGKGALYCDDQTIFVWSMAHDIPVDHMTTKEP